jgi:PAS domain S-box-containing protein
MVFRLTRAGILVDILPGRGLETVVRAEDCVGQPVEAFLPADAASLLRQAIQQTLETRTCQEVEYWITVDGTARYQEGWMVAYGDDNVLLVVRDVTKCKKNEQALRESEAKYQMLFEASTDAVLLETLDGQVLECNAAACEMYGLTREELKSKTVRDLVPKEIADALPMYIVEQLKKGGLRAEAEGLRADGTVFPTEVSTRLAVIGGEPRVIVYVRDITKRKRAEAARRESEARLRQVIDLVPHMIFAKDRQGRFILANKAVATAHGTTPEELVGKMYPHVRGAEPEYKQYLRDDLKVIETGQELFIPEENFTGIDGKVRILQTTKIPFTVSGSNERAVLGFAMDITERRQAEREREDLAAQLRQVQKLEALGQLAGGIAHDFNNLLTVITGSTELALKALGKRHSARNTKAVQDALEQVQQAGERAAALTRQLLTFSRRQVVRSEVVDANRIVSNLEQLLRRVIGENIALQTSLAPALRRIRVDANQLEQVIMNLVVNARDAMPQGGRMEIVTEPADLGAEYVAHHVDALPGPHVVIVVRDTGTGMDAQTISHIFEPFFTTKPMGSGTGLGLATVYGIVRQAGGHITVDSSVGQGTEFRVYFPAVEEPATANISDSDGGGSGGEETILLCEDEELVRRLACRVLEEAGYVVLDAENGREALEVAERHEGEIDLLITDLVMPELDGRDLAQALLVKRPGMGVLFISGYPSNISEPSTVCAEGMEFLGKPFRPPELLERVRAILDRTIKES